MDESKNKFIRLAQSKKFRLFLLKKLPAAYFCGVRVKNITEESCTVSVPFKWFSQNPFKSIYFACLAMAAELSTGALAMANVYKRKPSVSMLVVKMEAEFYKKATGKIFFKCMNGADFKNAVTKAIETNEPQMFTATSIGENEEHETVAKFLITWSFKSRRQWGGVVSQIFL